MNEPPICEMFDKIVQLGLKHGVSNLKDYPSAWIHKVDDQWTLALNGKDNELPVEPEGTMGISRLEPFHAAVWYNGWPAGILYPYGGEFAAGEGANEDTFIEALDRAIAA